MLFVFLLIKSFMFASNIDFYNSPLGILADVVSNFQF